MLTFIKTKLVFVILGLVVLVELILGARTLIGLRKNSATSVTPAPLAGGQIVLLAGTTTTKIGDEVPVSIRLTTGGHTTDGTDVVLTFDPKIMEASSSSWQPGTVYPDYPLVTINSQQGVVRISGISSATKSGFSGVGVFGTLSFKAKAKGTSLINVDYKPNLTTESNMVEAQTSRDIIEKVSGLQIVVN